MRCYKVGERIVLELDKALLPGEHVEIVLRVEDPTALPPMEQEPEIVREHRKFDPRAGYGQRYDPRVAYTGVEQRPDRPEVPIRPEALRRHGRK